MNPMTPLPRVRPSYCTRVQNCSNHRSTLVVRWRVHKIYVGNLYEPIIEGYEGLTPLTYAHWTYFSQPFAESKHDLSITVDTCKNISLALFSDGYTYMVFRSGKGENRANPTPLRDILIRVVEPATHRIKTLNPKERGERTSDRPPSYNGQLHYHQRR